jgi:hypothetical protein
MLSSTFASFSCSHLMEAPVLETLINMVLLSSIALMSSPSSASSGCRFPSSPGLTFSERSLALDSATETSSFTGGDSLDTRAWIGSL